ncbi:PfkB family carbohydrate kinase [Georgenia thermotolerans]|uniref:Carbohydrate kinase n=1 Tax=Georgenia thermotolerans TaxID=527326 RepID=A0A7J5UNI8_9MICO|nr:PfkB family carbohydrate kinase [Georgenia thermotolerans]KAE8763958.1 carbohydrate kinase [Georgenia thermotolerans]
MAGVVCCGLTTLDVTQVVDRLPAADEKLVARSLAVEVGGPAANAARTAAALGADVILVTALGPGPVADLVRAQLAAAGVRVVDVAADAAGPALSTVLVTAGTGERAVVSTNAVGRPTSPPPPAVLDGAGALLVDGHLLPAQVALAREARARGVAVLLDGGSWKPGLEELLGHVDLAVVSADLAVPAPVAGGAGAPAGTTGVPAAVAALGPVMVAQTHGAGPVAVLEKGRRYALEVPAVPPGEVVDTLGAGDVLHGAVAFHLAAGASWRNALARGTRVASRSVRFAGALGWAVS